MMAHKGSLGLLIAAATAAADQPKIKQARKKRPAPVEDPDPSEEGLTSGNEVGGAPVVKIHGNKRLRRHCNEEGCGKGSVGSTGKCIAHGGGKRCSVADCSRSAADWLTGTCIAHGGGEGPRHPASKAHVYQHGRTTLL